MSARPAASSVEPPRTGTIRPANAVTNRFGPQPSVPPTPPPVRPDVVRPAYLEEERQAAAAAAAAEAQAAQAAQGGEAPAAVTTESFAAADTIPCEGVLEFHPDGYGFLRAAMVPSSKDVHVAPATIRRYGLRMGDLVTGKARNNVGGDRNATMLSLTAINGQEVSGPLERPSFVELTATYPVRHMELNSTLPTRLADLCAPVGFGSRGLLMAAPNSGKMELMRDYATAISTAYPEVKVMVLLIDENPEDVTLFRDQVSCPVYAATFDQVPEMQFRLVDLVLERAKRIAEMGEDAVILVDSISRLAKISNSTSPTAGRTATGSATPTGLFRAKKLFGVARKLREAGSLTVLGTLNVVNGNKMDEAICEEFRDTVNMELFLDTNAGGAIPAINLLTSHTVRANLFLSEEQFKSMNQLRSLLAGGNPAEALRQLVPMVQSTATNAELLERLPDWMKIIGRSV